MFSSEFCEIFRNTFLTEHLQTTAFDNVIGKVGDSPLEASGLLGKVKQKWFKDSSLCEFWTHLNILKSSWWKL